MAVTLSSDLVVDVMRSADPARRNVAVARLQSQGGTDEPQFASALDKVQGKPVNTSQLTGMGATHRATDKGSTYQGFERMVLRNLFETLLPDQESGAFGGGPSAGVWRSMAADQLAGVYSASGGIGIADMLASAKQNAGTQHEAQWPYFKLDKIKSFAS